MRRAPLVVAALVVLGLSQVWAGALVLRERADAASRADDLAAARVREAALGAQLAQAQRAAQALDATNRALAASLGQAQTQAAGLAADVASLQGARDRTWASLNATLAARDALAAARSDEEAALNATAANLTAQLAKANADLADAKSRDAERQALVGELKAQQDDYAQLDASYQKALLGQFPSLASIREGNVTWQFTDAEGQAHAWRYRLEDYQAYAAQARPTAVLDMRTTSGLLLEAADPRPYATPSFFADKIGDITTGRTDRQFVRDAFEVKRQLVVYGFALADQGGLAYKYPAETLTEGAGLCGDTTILLASLLLAGDQQAHYGFHVKVWIVDVDPDRGVTIPDPQTVNHALLEVDYADGGVSYLETTTNAFYQYPTVAGWSYAVA